MVFKFRVCLTLTLLKAHFSYAHFHIECYILSLYDAEPESVEYSPKHGWELPCQDFFDAGPEPLFQSVRLVRTS